MSDRLKSTATNKAAFMEVEAVVCTTTKTTDQPSQTAVTCRSLKVITCLVRKTETIFLSLLLLLVASRYADAFNDARLSRCWTWSSLLLTKACLCKIRLYLFTELEVFALHGIFASKWYSEQVDQAQSQNETDSKRIISNTG